MEQAIGLIDYCEKRIISLLIQISSNAVPIQARCRFYGGLLDCQIPARAMR